MADTNHPMPAGATKGAPDCGCKGTPHKIGATKPSSKKMSANMGSAVPIA